MSANITGKTGVIGIFGCPVEHSFSPPMHNAAFKDLGLDFVYVPLPTAPEDLGDAVKGFRAMGMVGANVTIPHKTEIGQYLDALDPIAELTGSVNTLYYTGGKLRGTSTDPFGALENIRRQNISLQNKTIAILGYGGAARAIAFEICLQYPDQKLIIQGRNLEKGTTLVKELKKSTTAKVEFIQDYLVMTQEAEIIINCTSLGMHPNEDTSPCGSEDFKSSQVIYDIVYAPRETLWMKNAKAQGCQVIGGLGMLVFQGLKSFELWTGQEPKSDLMFKAVDHL